MSLPRILAIVGPTASGKTPVSILLAERMGGEIVSADSRQIYNFLDIGTAKPSPEDLQRVPHHFIGILDPKQDYSAGEYGKAARTKITEILNKGKLPILVGGSGLYVKAVVDGLFEGPGKDPEIRSQLESRIREHGAEVLLETLRNVDSQAAARMDPSKHRRIIRALEVYYITGHPISHLQKENDWKPKFHVVQFGIQHERPVLYKIIDERVDRMVSDGLIDEVRELRNKGYDTRLNSLNTVGYREVFEHLTGKMNKQEMIELIRQNTRRFAKRQLTWFRADKRIKWIEAKEGLSLKNAAEKIERDFSRGEEKAQHVGRH